MLLINGRGQTEERNLLRCAKCFAYRTLCENIRQMVKVMVFNATFNNISDISWQSVLLLEETGVPRENHPHAASH